MFYYKNSLAEIVNNQILGMDFKVNVGFLSKIHLKKCPFLTQ